VVEEQLRQVPTEQVGREVRVAMEQQHLFQVHLLLFLVVEGAQQDVLIIQHPNVASVASVAVAREAQLEHQLLRAQMELPIQVVVADQRLKKIMLLLQVRVADLVL
tara:strand:- start:54 stop:371 length:318 start_codon:yes stop_codon:yes gene_type:complete